MGSTTTQVPFVHPCLKCGACCAKFRVAFYWREGEPKETDSPVPSNHFEELGAFLRVMKGTTGKHHKRCVALSGKIGEKVSCSIYANRPTPCRMFAASFENGKRNIRCDEARLAYGLKPLQRTDWGEGILEQKA